MNNFSKNSVKSEKSASGLNAGVGKAVKTFGKASIAITAVVTAIKGISKVVKKSTEAFADFEMVKTNLQIVTGSAEKAEEQFKSLKELASKTPFEIEGLTNASILLQQSGVQAEDLTKTLRMLGDVAGGNNEKFNRIAINYAQIMSVGKASSMDMRQFAMAGLPVMKMMKDMGIQGQATAEEVTEMFKQMTAEGGQFFNGMSLQAETLNGKISTLKDTEKEYWAMVGESTGFAQMKKDLIELKTAFLQSRIDYHEELKNEKESLVSDDYGLDTWQGELHYNIELLNQYKDAMSEVYSDEEFEKLLKYQKLPETADENYIVTLQKTIDLIKSQHIQELQLLEIEKERREEAEKFNTEEKKKLDSASSLTMTVRSMYEDLPETKLKETQDLINSMEEMLTATYSTKTVSVTGNAVTGTVDVVTEIFDVLSKEEKEMYKAVIKDLKNKLSSEKDTGKTRDWFDAFSEITGVDITSLRGQSESGKKASSMYSGFLDNMKTDASKINKLFGKKIISVPDLLLNQKEGIVTQIQELLQEVDEKGNPLFSPDDNVIKGMVDKFKKVSKEVQKNYISNLPAEKGYSLIQGTDVGNFMEGMAQGGVWGGIANTFLSALSNAIGGLEGFGMMMNPITEMMKALSPTLKAILLPTLVLSNLIVDLGKGIQWLLNFLTGGLIDEMAEEWDDLVNESSELSENTKNVNENLKSLTENLKEFMEAIDKQEQYYIGEKMNIMAQNRYSTPVNDMILTPQGRFSTDPQDTIIATKNPQGLGGKVNVQINNYGNNEVSARQDNMGNIIIDISKKIASDYASGKNGWNDALSYRQIKTAGRSMS